MATVRAEVKKSELPLDLRGDGGYVVAPGSVHETGHVYAREGDWSVPKAELPVFPTQLATSAAWKRAARGEALGSIRSETPDPKPAATKTEVALSDIDAVESVVGRFSRKGPEAYNGGLR